MQVELFEVTHIEGAQPACAGSPFIPLRRETHVTRAIRRIESIMDHGYAICVAFSSGKDSSSLSNLVLTTASARISRSAAVPPIVVVHSNTGVEQPEITALANSEMGKMARYAREHGIGLDIRVGRPELSASFPVRVIGGRALPAFPDTRGDCSTDWKVLPNTKLLKEAAEDFRTRATVPDVVVMTGVRQSESAARDRKIEARKEVAEGVWTNDEGLLRASPILDWTSDDVFEYLGLCSAGIEPSYSDFADIIRIYRDAGGSSCVVVADMRTANQRTACGSRFGCWACTRVANDRSMANLIESDTERYGYLRPLAELRDFISNTQYDWSRRHFVGRTIDSGGFITIAADTYSPQMLEELLYYTLSAQAESGVEIIDHRHLVAIDARWSLYGMHPPFSALRVYFEVEDGLRKHPPRTTRFPKTPVPRIGRLYVGTRWEQVDGPASLSGLRDAAREMHSESCGDRLRVLGSGNLVVDYEEDGAIAVDHEGAIDFVEFMGREMVEQYCREDHPDWAAGYLTYLSYGTLSVRRGGSAQIDAILRRTRWRQANRLHGQQDPDHLRDLCSELYEKQMDLLVC